MFRPKAQALSLFDRDIIRRATVDSFRKLAPQHVAKNPVMFVVEIGSLLTTLILARDLVAHVHAGAPLWFTALVTVWLWFTVVFANFAEAVAEGRGKAQADTLRKMRKETTARKLTNGREEAVAPSSPPSGSRRRVGGGGSARLDAADARLLDLRLTGSVAGVVGAPEISDSQ